MADLFSCHALGSGTADLFSCRVLGSGMADLLSHCVVGSGTALYSIIRRARRLHRSGYSVGTWSDRSTHARARQSRRRR